MGRNCPGAVVWSLPAPSFLPSVSLTNGTSEVLFEDFEGYEGDAARCLDDLINTLQADPNVTDLVPCSATEWWLESAT